MKFEIKPPTQINSWKTSDGKIHHNEEESRRHEVFLAVNPFVRGGVNDRYIVICEIAKSFDLVPRTGASAPTSAFAIKMSGTRCTICLAEQFETPSGLTCKNDHGGADSI